MFHFIKRIKNDKKIYKDHLALVESLPEDYRFVFRRMKEYIWEFCRRNRHGHLANRI